MFDKKIVWEKWIDPLNKNIDEVEYPGHSSVDPDENRPIEFLSEDPYFGEKMDEQMEKSDEYGVNRNIDYNPIRIVSTPHGFVSLTEHSFASKHFDFWTLHYTKDITNEIIDAVEMCDGVETINPITRYRMRIGFNRPLIQSGAFELNKIRENIEKTIIGIENKNIDLRKIGQETKNDSLKKNNN